MNQDLSVLVVGTKKETEGVLSFLRQQEIPIQFHELEKENNFDAQTPAAYCGQFQAYGELEILKNISRYYSWTFDSR